MSLNFGDIFLIKAYFGKYLKETIIRSQSLLQIISQSFKCVLDYKVYSKGKVTTLGQIPAGACENVTSDLGLVGVFHRILQFPPPLRTG